MRDLEAVVDAAGLERFALFGHSQGGAIAIEYAVRHPERVSISCCSARYARGCFKRGLPPEAAARAEAQLKLVEFGLGPRDDPSYRQHVRQPVHARRDARAVALDGELQRMSSSPRDAVRILRAF